MSSGGFSRRGMQLHASQRPPGHAPKPDIDHTDEKCPTGNQDREVAPEVPVGGAHLVGQIEPHRRYAEGCRRRVALDALVLRPETAHPDHRELFPVAVESEQFLLLTRKKGRDSGIGAIR